MVLITLDTVRADHLHCYGDDNIKTPVIDGLARNGVLFEKAVAQTPLTEPSHASIFTGTNPNVHGVRDNGFALQPSSITMATILRDHGWNTAGFISAPVLQREFGFGQGFTTYDDQLWEDKDPNTNQPAASRPANITVDHAIRWLQSQGRKQPFFLWIHLYDAHQPYDPPAQFRKQYPADPYSAEIAFEDQQLGRFLKAVYQQSPANKTLVVLLSDHGEGLGQHGEDSHGVFLYDSTVRIAWIMTGPGIPAALRVQQQAREIDVLPTVLNLLGIKPLSAVQGTSMMPAFVGNAVPSTYSYEETLYPEIDMGWSKLLGIHTAHWMYVKAPEPELYDLDRDPRELHNVIRTHPKQYRAMDAQLKGLQLSGNSVTEKSEMNVVDSRTAEQLKSLGYIAAFSGSHFQSNRHAADPKDRVATLQLIRRIGGSDWEKLPSSTKAKLLLQALQKDSTNPFLYCTLGELYTQTGQYYAAQRTYLAALHMGIRSATLFSLLGDLYLHLGYREQATVFFEQAVQLNPRDVENQSNLGTAFLQAHRLTDAERQFRLALAIQPYAPAYNGLAIIAVYRNDDSTARQNFVDAIKLNPAYVAAQSNLGFLCLRTHDLSCARTAFEAVLNKAGPADSDFVPSAKTALASIPQP
ncbi:MAG TPA: sulfatase-like hydrolase/transferase [Terriglobales bacterium]|nr:sulfatase-like hydrolase/transferase [Terriglobales bacterium]